MKILLRFLTLFITLTLAPALAAQEAERILDYDVIIEVQKDADFIITEKISVHSEGRQIRRGIFRDLPRYKLDDGTPVPYRYEIFSVTRNGLPEPFKESSDENAERIRIGRASRFLPKGRHDYVIRYGAKNEVRYQDGFDEVYWNITGNYWAFPIEKARAEVIFPDDAKILEINAYTGRSGSKAQNASVRRLDHRAIIETSEGLGRREGLTVSVTIPKGIIDPPSSADKLWLWRAKNGAFALLTISLIGLFGFYFLNWLKVGKDPAKGPIFPRYAPPEGYSVGALHHIYNRGIKGHGALMATLMNLAVSGWLRIDKPSKRETIIVQTVQQNPAEVHEDDRMIFNDLFANGSRIGLDGKYNPFFARIALKARALFHKKYGTGYHQWNLKYVFLGIFLSVLAVMISFSFVHKQPSIWMFAGLAALIALNLIFIFIMPAPTKKGQAIRSEIEGFKLYLGKAESLQMNAIDIHSDAPPPLTKERYERFLPFAIALGEEKPWTKYFETVLPDVAQNYNPRWTSVNRSDFRSFSSMTNNISKGLSSGVSSAALRPSSSSGSSRGGGGGGFSGGGGGGGGGGGW